MGRTRRGGMAQWREGVDTCVFKPAVRCDDEDYRRPGISRIRKRSKAGRDIEVEDRIYEAFRYLVDVKAVSVYTHRCVPDYDEDDIRYRVPEDMQSSGCENLGDLMVGPNGAHVNLITEQFRGELSDYLFPDGVANQVRMKEWRSLIRRASYAAVTMVPDNGPWIIHTDCHLGNVLYRRRMNPDTGDVKFYTALGDWGRTLIIEDPKDIASVRQGIREWVGSIGYLRTRADAPVDRIVTAIQNVGERKQHPRFILDAVARLMVDPIANLESDMAILRGWVFYVLVQQTTSGLQRNADKPPADIVATLLTAPNRAKLYDLRDVILGIERDAPAAEVPAANPAGGMYWPTKYFKGLTRKQNLQRKRSATRRTKMSFKDPKAYVPFKSDKGVKTRRSSYTQRFHKKYPGVKSLPEIANATGIPKATLQKVYDRGMAAWRTGHRPGASQHAWGMARVHSFAMKGKTYRTADKDLV